MYTNYNGDGSHNFIIEQSNMSGEYKKRFEISGQNGFLETTNEVWKQYSVNSINSQIINLKGIDIKSDITAIKSFIMCSTIGTGEEGVFSEYFIQNVNHVGIKVNTIIQGSATKNSPVIFIDTDNFLKIKLNSNTYTYDIICKFTIFELE